MKRHWRPAVAVVLVTVGAVYMWSQWTGDTTVPASIGEALSSFRSHIGRAHRRPGLPKYGVYVYRTQGSETLDTAILGSTHKYRGSSTITVEPSTCGIRERWQVLTTRWNQSTTCQAKRNGLRASSLSEHHEFFGTVSALSYPCRDSHEPQASNYRIGLRWTISCGNSADSARISSSVVAFQAIKVDEERIPAFKIRSRVVFDGEVVGASLVRDWRRQSDSLLLRRTVDTKASVNVIGGGHYDENYSLKISSIAPHK